MPIYIRFENDKQVETTTLENKIEGWYEAPENFDWKKRYCLQEGEIVERSHEDIEKELLNNEKICALDSLRFYFNGHISYYTGHSLQKAKSYQIQAKAAENILVSPESIQEKYAKIIEPLAQVREISVIEMAKLIQSKAEKAIKAIAKYEELEDLAKKRIRGAKTRTELENFLSDFEQQIKNALTNL